MTALRPNPRPRPPALSRFLLGIPLACILPKVASPLGAAPSPCPSPATGRGDQEVGPSPGYPPGVVWERAPRGYPVRVSQGSVLGLLGSEGKETTRDEASGYGIDNETQGFEGNRPENRGISRLAEDHGRDGFVSIDCERGHTDTSPNHGSRCGLEFAFRPARCDLKVRQHIGGNKTDRGSRIHEQFQPGRTSRLCRMRDRDGH